MSHGSCVIAVQGPADQLERQVAWEMEPFEEYDHPELGLIDGSGWSWYELGGRRDGGLGGTNITQAKMFRKAANSHFACNVFLHNRLWHECAHRGVWPYEDEERKRRAGHRKTDPQKFFAKSSYDPTQLGEEIVWDETITTWERDFADWFIKPLHPEWFLVSVEYHV